MPKQRLRDPGGKLPSVGAAFAPVLGRWRYARNRNPGNSVTQTSFGRADGSTLTLQLGGTYLLTDDDVERARAAMIELEPDGAS